ncbi:hypothetical protein [Nocardia sp. NPDC006630]|uniref:hypothetical protein n=1 Tax=Nocardia sp. NPDC006630 TaxID=3157181 RepID=UPI0033BE2660
MVKRHSIEVCRDVLTVAVLGRSVARLIADRSSRTRMIRTWREHGEIGSRRTPPTHSERRELAAARQRIIALECEIEAIKSISPLLAFCPFGRQAEF